MLDNLGAKTRVYLGIGSTGDKIKVEVEKAKGAAKKVVKKAGTIVNKKIDQAVATVGKAIDQVEKIESRAGFFSNLFSCFTSLGNNDERLQEPKKAKVAPHNHKYTAEYESIKAKYSKDNHANENKSRAIGG